jgi:hypothetical protein
MVVTGEYVGEQVPAGLHKAICVNVFDVGVQPGYKGGPDQKKVVILWEIEPTRTKGDYAGKHFQVTKIYTASIAEKSNLGKDLEAWRGKKFSEEDRKAFDLDTIICKPCMLNCVDAGGKVKVDSVLPAVKDAYWSIETARDYIPKFVQAMIDGQHVEAPPKKEQFKDDIF